VTSTIDWPQLLIRPVNLVGPGGELLTGGDIGIAAIHRKHDQIWKNPPPCGSRVRFRPKSQLMRPENHGEFILDAADVESRMKEIPQDVSNMEQSIEKALLYRLSQRDNSLAEPADIPITRSRSENIVNELVRCGAGTVRCRQYDRTIPGDKLNSRFCNKIKLNSY